LTYNIIFFTENLELGEISPIIQVAYFGDTVIINCQSVILPRFTKYSLPLKYKHVIKQNQLFLFDVTIKHSGTYVCHGTYKNTSYSFTVTSELYVGGV